MFSLNHIGTFQYLVILQNLRIILSDILYSTRPFCTKAGESMLDMKTIQRSSCNLSYKGLSSTVLRIYVVFLSVVYSVAFCVQFDK